MLDCKIFVFLNKVIVRIQTTTRWNLAVAGDDVIEFGGNFSKSNGTLTIKNFDIDGALTNKLGVRGIKDIIIDFGKQQGVKQVIIEGAKRTTGAKPGRIPSQLIFKIE